MTSQSMSDALKKLGIKYAAGSVRNAWSRGAPKESATAFASWIAANAERKTEASEAAKEFIEVHSQQHGLMLLIELMRSSGVLVRFWMPAGPIFWESFLVPSSPDARTVSELLGQDGFKALHEVINGLGVLIQKVVPIHEELTKAGISADAQPWIDATHANHNAMIQRGRDSFERFAAAVDAMPGE